MANMPDVWGAGQLLAFSGVDGHTDWSRPFVLHTGEAPGSLVVRLPVGAPVSFAGLREPRFRLVLGDAIEAECAGGRFRAAFVDHHTLTGEMPAGAGMAVAGRAVGPAPVLAGEANGLGIFGAASGTRWALLLSPAGEGDAAGRARAALAADLDATLNARAAFVRDFGAPAGLDPGRERLLRKAISVMKVNLEAPRGRIGRRWTTPDRWPHRHMWLWDSAFHGVGWAHVEPAVAADAILAILEQVQPDGLLPHMVPPEGPPSQITQPPVLGWAALTLFRKTGDRDWAAQCLPYLFRYLEWIRVHRDQNGNGIPEWRIEGSPLCRSGESGLDNSPRFDSAVLLDAVDFASFLCSDYRCVAEIAAAVGQPDVAETCAGHAGRIAAAVNDLLWDGREGFYFDRQFDGSFTGVKAVSGFMPLFAGIAGPARAEALRCHLRNPDTFGAPLPIPSVSLDSGVYCKDMWRGPAWLNLNYLTVLGLRRCGFAEDATRLREQSLAAVQKWYEREGCLFEYFDSLDITSPRALDRKQRLITGRGLAPISDYHWTAALTAAMLLAE